MAFGVRQFELTLMHRMRDLNPERVEEALAQLHASRAELRAAHTQWTRMAYSGRAPRGMAKLRMALGPPLSKEARPIGSLTCEVAHWILPTWPELRFEVLLGPDGVIWNEWLVRPSGPKHLSFADLSPWQCVVGDVEAGFPGAKQGEGSAPHHWVVDFTHEGTAYRARFVYGLFQRLDEA